MIKGCVLMAFIADVPKKRKIRDRKKNIVLKGNLISYETLGYTEDRETKQICFDLERNTNIIAIRDVIWLNNKSNIAYVYSLLVSDQGNDEKCSDFFTL